MSNKILITDSTLRDGSHAMRHKYSLEHITEYAKGAEAARIPVLVVGHGNGLGASSIQLGKSLNKDFDMIKTAWEQVDKTSLGVFMIPGFATIKRDLEPVLDFVDVVMVASHCSEADTTQKHLEYVNKKGKKGIGVLMMSHMLLPDGLLEQAKKMQGYGASAVLLMDSSGTLTPKDVKERVQTLTNGLDMDVGFHAHNNLGLAVANSLTAVESGAKMIDTTSRGFGAGAGNCPMEVFVALMKKLGIETGLDLYKLIDLGEKVTPMFMKEPQTISGISLVSGLAGVFSGFCPLAKKAALEYGVDARDILVELGNRKVVAGQEDYIIEAAIKLSKKK